MKWIKYNACVYIHIHKNEKNASYIKKLYWLHLFTMALWMHNALGISGTILQIFFTINHDSIFFEKTNWLINLFIIILITITVSIKLINQVIIFTIIYNNIVNANALGISS